MQIFEDKTTQILITLKKSNALKTYENYGIIHFSMTS